MERRADECGSCFTLPFNGEERHSSCPGLAGHRCDMYPVHIPGWDLAHTEAAGTPASPSWSPRASRARLGAQEQKEPRNAGEERVRGVVFL